MDTRQISMFDFVDEPGPASKPEEKPLVQDDAPLQVNDAPLEIEILQESEDAGTEEPVANGEGEAETTPKPQHGRKTGRGRFRIADLEGSSEWVEIPEDEQLFAKQYYSIGDVANMFKVNISLIRYWENEFPILKPKKNGKGDRLFRPVDVKNLKLIHYLLREKKYTIDGAKDFLKHNKKAEENFELIENLKKLKQFLLHLRADL